MMDAQILSSIFETEIEIVETSSGKVAVYN